MDENIVKNELFERSLSSDGTEFFDFPLPPIPTHCVEVQNLDVNSSILYARIRDSYDIESGSMADSLEELRSSYSLDDENDSTIHCQNTQSSDPDDEDSSTSYRDKSPLLRRTQSSSPDNNRFYHNCYRG